MAKSGTTTKTSSPSQYVQGPPSGAAARTKDAANTALPFAIKAAFEATGSSPSLEERREHHSAPTFAMSSVNQAAGRSGKAKIEERAGASAFRRSEDNTIRESVAVSVQPKKPSHIGNTKI